MFFFLAAVMVGSVSAAWLSRPKDSCLGHFNMKVNDQYSVLFDTGSDRAWIMSGGFRTRARSFYPCMETLTYGVGHGRSTHVNSVTCTYTHFQSGLLHWSSNLQLVDSPKSHWNNDGIIGAALSSRFASAFPNFTIIPRGDHYDLLNGEYIPRGSSCVQLPITKRGRDSLKWIIKGSMSIEGMTETLEFETDTGFGPIAMTRRMFEVFTSLISKRGGRVTSKVRGQYARTVESCVKGTIPSVTYGFVSTDGRRFNHTVSGDMFTAYYGNGKCEVMIMVLAELSYGYSYLGVPFLRDLSSRWQGRRQQLAFCN